VISDVASLGTPASFPPKQQLHNARNVVLPALAMLKVRKRLFLAALIGFALLGLTGCTSNQQESSIPWSRPASWEGQIPGVTGTGR